MKISDSLLPEFDQESAMTRSVLERCPEAKFNFKPHAKSWELVKLASHLANPPGAEPYKEEIPTSTKALIELFDKNCKEARAAIVETPNEEYMKDWALLNGGQKLFSMPKMVCLRSFVFNHAIFHRGQLAVYLRLIDVPVPALYGPSADESGM